MRRCDSWKEAPSNQPEWLNGNKSQNPKKSLEEKQDFPKSLEPELNTEQPNFLLLIFSQPEKKTAFIEQHSKVFLCNIQKKKKFSISKKFMIISPWFVRRRLCDINIQSLLLLSGHFKNFHNNSWSRVGQYCLKTKNKVTLAKT